MKQEIAIKWVEALRSGEYKQGRGQLMVGDTYCCLGVLCAISDTESAALSLRAGSATLPEEVKKWAGMATRTGGRKRRHTDMYAYSLIGMNDAQGRDFLQIADVIEQEWADL